MEVRHAMLRPAVYPRVYILLHKNRVSRQGVRLGYSMYTDLGCNKVLTDSSFGAGSRRHGTFSALQSSTARYGL